MQQMDDNGLTPPFLALNFEGEQDDLVHLLESLLQNSSSESGRVREQILKEEGSAGAENKQLKIFYVLACTSELQFY